MLDAIQAFLSAAVQDELPSVTKLARSLDRLALAYADVPVGDPSDDSRKPPKRDYASTCDLIRRRFPHLGHYGVADPLKLTDEGWMVGDAVDDIADIVGETSEIIWRHKTIGPDDANWHFRFSFESHWGRHLRDLQSFIHAKRFYYGD